MPPLTTTATNSMPILCSTPNCARTKVRHIYSPCFSLRSKRAAPHLSQHGDTTLAHPLSGGHEFLTLLRRTLTAWPLCLVVSCGLRPFQSDDDLFAEKVDGWPQIADIAEAFRRDENVICEWAKVGELEATMVTELFGICGGGAALHGGCLAPLQSGGSVVLSLGCAMGLVVEMSWAACRSRGALATWCR